jgi:dihydrofolate reductase
MIFQTQTPALNALTIENGFKHIVSVNSYGGIGKDGKQPWYISEDLKRFKELTQGHTVVMGRKTYLDIERIAQEKGLEFLPGRKCYVVSNTEDFTPQHAIKIPSVGRLRDVNIMEDGETVFVIGGYYLYVETLPFTTHCYMTVVKNTDDCDVFYPIKAISSQFMPVNKVGEFDEDDFVFVDYTRT